MTVNKKETPLSRLLFDDVERINFDQDYWFQLRGSSANCFIDAATPLLGLSLRVRSLAQCPMIEAIYDQTVEEIKAIDIELTEQGIDHPTLMAYRYVLCAYLDEAVMGTEWGSSSSWAEYSMLSRFHNETWGGEKVFSILTRLLTEPERYKALLQFVYHCLILGFEGKYKVMEGGKAEREKVISRLHLVLSDANEENVGDLIPPSNHVVKSKYKVSQQLPIWLIFAGFFLFLAGVFLGYSYLLHKKSTDVLTQLNQIL